MDEVASKSLRPRFRRDRESPRYDAYLRLYTLLFFVLFLGFLVAMALYGERFDFWRYPYSGLGATVTENGYANPAALVVFVTDMVCISIILVAISIVSGADRALSNRGLRTLFSATGAFGALVATFPHNLYPPQHAVGSAFLVGSLWVLALLCIIDVSVMISAAAGAWLHLVLHVSVVSYAITYLLDALSKQVFQKFAVFGLCGVLLAASRILVVKVQHAEEKAFDAGLAQRPDEA